MTALLLEASGLSAYYGATQALFGLDLAVEAGGITTLLGATGTCKTMTMAGVIERLQKPALVLAHNKTLAAQLCN